MIDILYNCLKNLLLKNGFKMIEKKMIELGHGFVFIGRQYHTDNPLL